MKKLCALAAFVTAATLASATIIQIDLIGKGGSGLLSGNENGTINGTPGSGGEVGAGISYDDASNDLTINIGWGTGNGFINLSGNATAGHIHGTTASNAPASFNENAGVLIGLDGLGGWNANASSGGLTGTVNLSAGQETALLNGQLYINVHTAVNGGGEIRGQLIAVPEPSTYAALLGLAGLAFATWRRRQTLAT